MDLIYAKGSLTNEQGILKQYTFDIEISNDPQECTFEIKMPLENNPLAIGDFVKVDGMGEYGGQVDQITINTSKQLAIAKGRTWRGLMGSHIVEPYEEEDYLEFSNMTVDQIINNLLIRYFNLQVLYPYTYNGTSPKISKYRVNRYEDLYTVLIKLCASVNYKLGFKYSGQWVYVYAMPIAQYTSENSVTSDLFDFEITEAVHPNHIIGLGQGQLKDRYVVHRYLHDNGTINDEKDKHFLKEITILHDESNLSNEELDKKVEEVLKKASQTSQLKITAKELNADFGDKITASDIYTGITITQYVTSKIITMNDQDIKQSYKVGGKI